ncbi:MAG: bifunctional adenosylcobinamide kinase/adenosylcobinamide-phosphate guanylyltransferase [Armatimonadetes bacterium]|nr:bifunctional adenosylcobinamide kinase/adenosylcobinamide-phosphate guanylyltransferase [Armatimonadota bacterium]
MGKIIFIFGGARSGKSRYAQARAAEGGPRVTYLATADAGDAEMAARIARHRRDRPGAWRTVEAPRSLAAALRRCAAESDTVLVDCLTLFLSNALAAPGADPEGAAAEALAEMDAALAAAREMPATVLLVSNEVGMGLVPPYPLGRAFRDLAGSVNQRVAAAADEVYFVAAGLPLRLK